MDDRRNILLITTDHLRYDTLGCHGDPVIRTPNIDRLAAQSIDFANYFVQNPVCQPFRTSALPGLTLKREKNSHTTIRGDQTVGGGSTTRPIPGRLPGGFVSRGIAKHVAVLDIRACFINLA